MSRACRVGLGQAAVIASEAKQSSMGTGLLRFARNDGSYNIDVTHARREMVPSKVEAEKPTLSWYLLLCGLLSIFIGLNIAYLAQYRFEGVMTFDEAAYISLAMTYTTALKLSIGQWLRALFSPLSYAPLLPAVTSLGLYWFGSTEAIALCANVLMSALLLSVIYHFATWLSGRYVGLVTALVTGVVYEVQAYATSFMFAIPTALFFVCALYTYVRSENFVNQRWSLAFGVSLALMVLSRTMAVAFLPAFALVGGVYLFYDRSHWGVKWRHLGLAVLVFCLVALPWYVRNAEAVFGYLTSYGYGAHVAEYDPFGSPLSWLGLKLRLAYVTDNCGLLCVTLIGAGLLSYAVRCSLAYKSMPIDRYLAICWSIGLVGEGILCSSRNVGSAFELPLVAALVLAAVSSLFQWVKGGERQRRGALGLCVVLAGLYIIQQPVVIFSFEEMARSHRRLGLGPTIFSGAKAHVVATDLYFHYVDSFFPLKNEHTIDQDLITLTRQWRQFNKQVAATLEAHNPDKYLMLYASRHVFLNANTFALEVAKSNRIAWRDTWPMIQVDPILLTHSVPGYEHWLAALVPSHNCFAVFLSDNQGDCAPFVNIPLFRQALRASGYHELDALQTPTPGQKLYIWKNEAAYCDSKGEGA